MTRRRVVLGAAAAGVVAAAVAAWLLFPRDSATPVAVGEVHAGTSRPAAGRGPAPGVYLYATSGWETVDAFGGARHRYPARTAAVVRPAGCGFELDWHPLEERRTVWRLCPSSSGVRFVFFREFHRFFGRSDRRTYRCDAHSLLAPAHGRRFSWRCNSGDTTETGSGVVVGRERIRAGGSPVETVHVRISTSLDRAHPGGGPREFWLRPADGLPVRVVEENRSTTGSFLGDVHYAERFELRLLSLKPRA